MIEQIEQKLGNLHTELKSYFSRTDKKFDSLQRQVDAIDLADRHRHSGPVGKSLETILGENDSVQRLIADKKGRAYLTLSGSDLSCLERKTTIDSAAVGAMTSGVLMIDRIPGITAEARQVLRVRDVLTARPTTLQLVDFVKVNAPMAIASPQMESSDKAQNAVTFTTQSETVRTIATWIPASRQVLDDMGELSGFLLSTLPYYVNLEEELQLLSGAGTGVNLNGLVTQATSFNTALLSAAAGWNKIDIIGRAIQQITAAKELEPTFAVVHPTDWWGMRLQKDSYGRYILGDPQQMVRPTLFGLEVVPTTSIASGTFLVGSGNSEASEIRDRMEMQVEISTEHSDYFVKNLVAIRAEKRLALIVKRPASYITGTFTTSP